MKAWITFPNKQKLYVVGKVGAIIRLIKLIDKK